MADLRKNGEGYADPTANAALAPIVRQETETEKRANVLIKTLKSIIALAGFELIGRIVVRDVKTRREFKK